jgi:hypothetical protein
MVSSMMGGLAVLWGATVHPASAAPAGCVQATGRAELRDARLVIEAAYQNLDTQGASVAVADLERALACVGVVLSPKDTAAIHRALALAALLSEAPQAVDTARLHFAASRKVEPDWRFPATLVPDDPSFKEWDHLAAVPVSMSKRAPIPAPETGQLLFEGEPAPAGGQKDGHDFVSRETAFPTLVQHVDDEGRVRFTRMMGPGQYIDGYPGHDWHPTTPDPGSGRKRWTAAEKGIGISSLVLFGAGTGLLINAYGLDYKHCWEDGSEVRTCPTAYFDDVLTPRWIAGWSLVGIGAAGMATTGIMVGVRDTGASISIQGRW